MLSTGTLFNQHYRVLRCIRAGGMGAVYEVLDERTQRRRALKVMLPSLTADPELRSRFSLEITVAANVDSEHIVEVLDAGIDQETQSPFYVMELLKGEDLASALEARGPMSLENTYVVLQQLSLALDRTHAQSIVHRDLKPGNLFLTFRDDGGLRLKILDFGIAKVTTQASHDAKTTRSIGTPLYMSPEQVMGDGKIGPASDRYALAHLAYTMLVGEAYFERDATHGTVYQVLMKVVAGITEVPSARARACNISLPPAFDAWFQKATQRNPAQRFASAIEMLRAFAEVFALEPPHTDRVPRLEAGIQSGPRLSQAELATTQRFVAPDSRPSFAGRPQTLSKARRWAFAALGILLLGVPVAFFSFAGARGDAQASAQRDGSQPAKSEPTTPSTQPETNRPATLIDVQPTPSVEPSVAPSAVAPVAVSNASNTVRGQAGAHNNAGSSTVRRVTPKRPPKPEHFDPTDIR